MIKSLEGIRGIAALIVALYHLEVGADHFSIIRNGYLFVDLFFVLSGFVMYASYASSLSTTVDFRAFLIRRIGRLMPLLIFSTLFFVFVANVIVLAKRAVLSYGSTSILHSPEQADFLIPAASEVIATLTLTHGMGVFDRLILNTPSWSISVEFYAYVLFAALCLLLVAKKRIAAFAILSVIGLVISIWASVMIHDCLVQKGCLSLTYDFAFPRAVHSFFMGALVACFSHAMSRSFESLQLPACGMLVVLLSVVDAYPIVSFAFPLAFAILILSICHDEGRVASILKPRFFQMLGQRSYSIYLMHMPLLLLFSNLVKRVDSGVLLIGVLLLYVAVVVTVSGWTYRFIEDPLRIRFNRLASQFSRAPANSPLNAVELREAPSLPSDPRGKT